MENEAREKKPDPRIISELRSDEERVVLKTIHILKSKSHIN